MIYVPKLWYWPSPLWKFVGNCFLRLRVRGGKIDAKRVNEYRGVPSVARPEGDVLWIHGVSVGESSSSLPLIRAIQQSYPDLHIVLTTTTYSSGQKMENELPEGVFHQYLPFDHRPWVERFFAHWSPRMGIWLESELWPNLCEVADIRGIDRVMLNGRISLKSQGRWSFVPRLSKGMIKGFRVILVQNIQQLGFFHSLDAFHARVGADLKSAADPLPYDSAFLKHWQERIKDRPFWLATSTHEGEESIIVQAHQLLREQYPDLLCIIAPRHPERGKALQQQIHTLSGFSVTLASEQDYLPATDIHLADSMGQLGTFYRLASFAFIGGSLVDKGGHNMREAILLQCLPIVGPYLDNFLPQKTHFIDFLTEVYDAPSLARAVQVKLAAPQSLARKAEQAQNLAVKMQDGVIDEILQELVPLWKES